MPFGAVGTLAHRLLIGRDLERIFDYRSAAVAELLGSRTEVTPPTRTAIASA